MVLDSPREAAAHQLKEDCSDRVLVALREEAKRLRALGEVAFARQVDQRAATKLKRALRVSNPMRLALRTEAVQRSKEEAAERERAAAQDPESKRLRLEGFVAKSQAALERARAMKSGQALRREELFAKAKRAAERLAARKQQHEAQTMAHNIAADSVERLRRLPVAQREALDAASEQRGRHRAPPALAPDLWPQGVSSSGLRLISVHKKPSEPRVYASERFALAFFLGRRPQDVPPANAGPAFSGF